MRPNTCILVSSEDGRALNPSLIVNSFAVTSNEAKAFTAHRDENGDKYACQPINDPGARTEMLENAQYAICFQANTRRLTGDANMLYVQRHREKRGSLGYRVTIYKRMNPGQASIEPDHNLTIVGAFPGFLKCGPPPPDVLASSTQEQVIQVDSHKFGFATRKLLWFTGGTWDARTKKHLPFSLYATPMSHPGDTSPLQSMLNTSNGDASKAGSPYGVVTGGESMNPLSGLLTAAGEPTLTPLSAGRARAASTGVTPLQSFGQQVTGHKRRRVGDPDSDPGYDFRRLIMKLACDGATMDQFMKACVDNAKLHNDVGFLFAVDSSKMGAILTAPNESVVEDQAAAILTGNTVGAQGANTGAAGGSGADGGIGPGGAAGSGLLPSS
eukprot:TRINITY_DN2355_c0_g1_i2.p1 TRINITY_DN2355_c0_g1~~TRINITY_DN2355_c0_g1_i2.p1  ORF type:complete len:384 (-),score=44.19 TRINITY_DN2355_c0_g1_i2:97-1248(-)